MPAAILNSIWEGWASWPLCSIGVNHAARGVLISIKVVTQNWPPEAREAAQLVARKYGEPDESCHTTLTWGRRGPWKRIVAHRDKSVHNFPVPHVDLIECFVELPVPAWTVTDLVRFDGSIAVYRTQGEISARCQDEELNFLALNLAYDIISSKRSVEDARRYYVQEFLNSRRKALTPYMTGLKFEPYSAEDPDERIVSEVELRRAVAEGKKKSKGNAA